MGAWIWLKAHGKFGNKRELFPSPVCNDNIIFKCMYLASCWEMHSMLNKCSIDICFVFK